MREDACVVSCGYAGVVACACATAGTAMTAAAAMNFRNMLLPPSIRFIHQSTPRRSFVHEELARKGVQAMDREDHFSPVCITKCATNFEL
jgi:hypothetical protein